MEPSPQPDSIQPAKMSKTPAILTWGFAVASLGALLLKQIRMESTDYVAVSASSLELLLAIDGVLAIVIVWGLIKKKLDIFGCFVAAFLALAGNIALIVTSLVMSP